MLKVSNLRAGYGPGTVLFDVNFEIGQGEILGLLGRNGMGKSTLIWSLFGQTVVQSGRVEFDGQDITGWASDRIARAGIAIVPEGRQCFPNLTVKEHLTVFAARRDPRAREVWDAEGVFELFPRLRERATHLGQQLSGGEQQMLAIGRALVTQPKLLILDEASEGLAPLIRAEIWRCLAQLREAGQTILIVDKYVERLIKLADRHLIIEKGVLVWQGTSEALDNDRALWTRYLGVEQK